MENNQYRLTWEEKGAWILICFNVCTMAYNALSLGIFMTYFFLAIALITVFTIFMTGFDSLVAYTFKRTFNLKTDLIRNGIVAMVLVSSLSSLAMAFPHSDYIIRSAVIEGNICASGLRKDVSKAFIDNGTDGIRRYAALIAADLSDIVTKKVTNVVISTAPATMGFISIKMGGIRQLDGNDILVHSPHIDRKILSDANRAGNVRWVCAGETGTEALAIFRAAGKGTIIDKYIPNECKF